jgi:sugar phosphate isomerase/epimerase
VTGAEYYPHFIKAMHEIGFSGYMGYELCHTLPVENGQTVGIEYAKRKAKDACEFMKGMIKDVTQG